MGIGIDKYQSMTSQLLQSAAEKNVAGSSSLRQNIKQDTYEHVEQASVSEAKDSTKVKLSDKAQKVLDELKKKYGNTDFFVADYSSDEEAGQILSNSTKEFGVVITPDELEKMASDEDYCKKISGSIADSQQKLTEFKNSMSESKQSQIKSLGISIGEDGNISFFAELEKQTRAASERIKDAKNAKDAKDAKEAKNAQDSKDPKDLKNEEGSDSTDGDDTKSVHQKGFVNGSSLDELSKAIDKFLTSDDNIVGASHIDYQL